LICGEKEGMEKGMRIYGLAVVVVVIVELAQELSSLVCK